VDLKILLATKNDSKIREMKRMLGSIPRVNILTYKDVPFSDVVEDRHTTLENAKKKAVEVSLETGYMSLADDTGLFVEALGGRPGVKAARYAGENATDEENINKLISELDNTESSAKFETSLVLADCGKVIHNTVGVLYGTVDCNPVGVGFAYDPIYKIVTDYGVRSLAELETCGLKDFVSHRGDALRDMKIFISSISILEKKEEPEIKDNVNSPNHYCLEGLDIEVIDVIKSRLGEGFVDYCVGNVIKYIMRADKKNGMEDYKKARKYLDFIIED